MTASAAPYSFLTPPTSDGYLGSLAHYQVISELGRGGMGYVFRAQDIKLKRPVALKVMNQKISAIPGSRKRFISEARAMAAVHHDNVATIFEVGESGGTPFMAMEMLRGETLEELNKRKEQLDFEVIIKYATEIARGLAAAHARGIVHRDIKPANIWIEEGTDRIKILDFGLALASTPVDQLAGRGAVVGTPGYLSPEQARSDPLDDRSDLYSLGVVLYELCTGRIPLQSKSVHAQLISILTHRPIPISELNPDIPKPLCDAVHRLLRKEPRSRYQSAKVLEAELVEVEAACHQQSEVGQAINRLKEGLSQVVVPSEPAFAPAPAAKEVEFSSFDDVPAPVLDPLAGVPIPASSKTRPVAAARRPVAKKSPSQGWQKFVPVMAIAGALLIALSLVAYALIGFGKNNKSAIVKNDPVQNKPDQPKKKNDPKPKVESKPQSTSKTTSKPAKSDSDIDSTPLKPWERRQKKAAEAAGKKWVRKKPKAKGKRARKTKTNESKNTNDSSAESVAKVSPAAKPPSIDAIVPSNQADKPAMKNATDTPANTPSMVVSISTLDGRGADAMVQINRSEKYGAKQLLGIRTREGVELNHAYLRFDLAGLKGKKSKIRDARLVLHVVNGKTPVGAEIRVIGIDDVGVWPEESLDWGNSPSNMRSPKPLSSFSTIAQTSVIESQSPPGTIYLGGPDLVNYLKQAEGTVTLAVAGQWESKLLRIVSRERSPEEAPLLQISVPK